jgi:SAM-dependent methyltransferase
MQKKTFQHLDEQSDLGIKTYSDWPIWKYTIPFPSTVLMGSSGTPELGRFLAIGSAWAQVVGHFMPINASILDIGCGCSKTARFLASDPRVKDYFGFDPMRDCIEWSNRYVKPYTEDRFLFEFVDLQSNEYNPYGTIKAESYRFPIETNSIDTVIAASVFTHLLEPATRQYLDQIGRVLKAGGCAIFSLHTEPAKDQNFSGNEGRVDVNLGYFLALAKSAGLSLLEDLGSLCGQEAIVLVKTRPVSPCL